ncbi:hypothetical protein LZC95_48815 [Pendulispora brunnea]|uniref:Uncharacterized protein n=1 Tax=Pendulispora brunnea TaxID=2905690 RepID=A0ABZ2K6L8_9BACT
MLPGRRLGALGVGDARMNREQRGARHGVLQPRPRRQTERLGPHRQSFGERSDPAREPQISVSHRDESVDWEQLGGEQAVFLPLPQAHAARAGWEWSNAESFARWL